MAKEAYDLAIIGSGPAGQKAAFAAAKLGKRVLIIDINEMMGGVCLHTGTIPSKTLREAVLYLTGFRQRTFYGQDYNVKARIARQDLMFRVEEVVKRTQSVIREQLQRNRIDVLGGRARFLDPHTLEIRVNEEDVETATAEFILIACGTRPSRPDNIPFTPGKVLDADQLLLGVDDELPKSAIIVGGGVIGLEYASMAAALGVEVTLVESRVAVIDFVDREIVEALMYHLRQLGAVFRLEETVAKINVSEAGMVSATLDSGKTITAERLLYAIGRQGNADQLNAEVAGLTVNDRGRVEVNETFQTVVPHIYAAGDVIGFPSLASTSMEQGRLASCHMFGAHSCETRRLMPYGIYTIPEISTVGRTESQLTADKIPYETGVARFEEIVRAQIIGDRSGMLKLLFHSETLELLGVHILGDGASELIHIGQMLMLTGGSVETLRDTVFNYPTLAEAYKVAANNGLNKLARLPATAIDEA